MSAPTPRDTQTLIQCNGGRVRGAHRLQGTPHPSQAELQTPRTGGRQQHLSPPPSGAREPRLPGPRARPAPRAPSWREQQPPVAGRRSGNHLSSCLPGAAAPAAGMSVRRYWLTLGSGASAPMRASCGSAPCSERAQAMSRPQLRECSAQLWLNGAVTTLLTSESLSWHLHGVGLRGRTWRGAGGASGAVASRGSGVADGPPQPPNGEAGAPNTSRKG